MTGSEGFVSTDALNQPTFSISSLRSLTSGPWMTHGVTGVFRGTPALLSDPIQPGSGDCMDRRCEALHSPHRASDVLHSP
jgi:hypothetical protein